MPKANPIDPPENLPPIEETLPGAPPEEVESFELKWKRALADYQNLVRRVDQEKKDFSRVANANLIARLLPSLDIIDMAAGHSKDIGVEMAAKQFSAALVEEGLKVIEPKPGDKFDHKLHECSETVKAEDDSKDDTISELVLKGYQLGEFVLRAARVKVYKLALDN